jgi:ABC-3C biological conflict system middle component
MTVGTTHTELPAAVSRRLSFPEAAALFNPALGALIITAAAVGHVEGSEQGLPWLGSFLVTPFVLHDPTRLSLPRNIRTSMASWLAQNPLLGDEFGKHANLLAPTTRRAIRYALRSGIVSLEATRLTPGGRVRGLSGTRGEELRAYYAAGRLVGRWIATADVLTAYSILGVRL